MSQQSSTKLEEQIPEIQEQQAEGVIPEEKSSIRANFYPPTDDPEFRVGDSVSVTALSGRALRKIVAKITQERWNSNARYYEYRLASPADTNKWYPEGKLEYQ